MAVMWAATFAYLSVVRHLAGGSHAEDLGFTDQVLWNFLPPRDQWFRMSLYQGAATWNTELDLSHIARPDSLLAFHVEPMLLAFVPLYALGAGATVLLLIQAAAVAAGALPAFRLARHLCQSPPCGVAVAAAYLLSPLGQWAVLADFHTSTLAAPLLLFSLERLVVGRAARQALLLAALACSAREDVGPAVACIGIALLLRRHRVGLAYVAIGTTWTILALLVIRNYSGGFSPFSGRYSSDLTTLVQPTVVSYVTTLLLSGGWLGLLAPLALLPALPSLALNVLSTSPWMASGQAHYSGLVLPFVTVGAAAGLSRFRRHPRLLMTASVALIATTVMTYLSAGAGPLGGNYAPARVTDHAALANTIAAEIPPSAGVSASSSLVPHLSHRARVYVFPAVLDADYVYVDLTASPAPTSAGDVYLRAQSMLSSGEWNVAREEDGLLLLEHSPTSLDAGTGVDGARPNDALATTQSPHLLSAALVPSPDAAVGVDGPHWILRTVWQIDQPLPSSTRLEFTINLRSGEQLRIWDIAPLWWDPPDQWPANQPVNVDVPDVPVREFVSWSATWSMP